MNNEVLMKHMLQYCYAFSTTTNSTVTLQASEAELEARQLPVIPVLQTFRFYNITNKEKTKS